MNNDELRAALDAAKTYKAKQLAEAEAYVRAAKTTLLAAEARFEAWQRMIPADVMRVMQEEAEHEARNSEQVARAHKAESIHAAALREAYAHGKGLLPPEAASKSISFGVIGAFVFCSCAVLALKALAGVDSELSLTLVGALGGLVGLFAGFAFFNAHFVVDESLERGVFAHFSARETVSQTYFKSRDD